MAESPKRTPDEVYADIVSAIDAGPVFAPPTGGPQWWTAQAEHDTRLAELWAELAAAASTAPEWARVAASLLAAVQRDRAAASRFRAAEGRPE
jgi:hypothetical protein